MPSHRNPTNLLELAAVKERNLFVVTPTFNERIRRHLWQPDLARANDSAT